MNIFKTRNIRNGLYFIAVMMLAACQKDTNTYEYSDLEVIQVEGIAPSYEVLTDVDVLKIPISVSSNMPKSEFEYVWGIYSNNTSGSTSQLDTISKEKDLVLPITLPAQGYTLVNIVKNKTTGLSKYSSTTLSVNTEYTRGWYVLKDDGENSDLDQFFTQGSIVPGIKTNSDIFSRLNGGKIAGRGLRLTYLTDYKSTVESPTPANTKTLFVGTEKEMSAVFINTLRQYRDRNSLFFAPNEQNKDMILFTGQNAQYILNAGRVQGIYTLTPNTGTFGGYAMRDADNTPYELAPYFLTSSSVPAYLFDNRSSSFVFASNASSILTAVGDATGTELSARNNNKRLLYMAYESFQLAVVSGAAKWLPRGWALFEDKTTGAKTVAYLRLDDDVRMYMRTLAVPSTAKLYNSSKHAKLLDTENVLYFAHNNRDVYSFNLNSGAEALQFSAPAGEEITFIRHRRSGESGYSFDYIMVGTKVGNQYKVRMFEKTGSAIKPNPIFTLEGTGTARDAMYISQSVTSTTYPTGD